MDIAHCHLEGYKPNVISTIVDSVIACASSTWAISQM